MEKRTKLDDSGVFIPYAKKHLSRKRESSACEVTLKSVWPEPNWAVAIGSPEMVAFKAVIYRGLRSKPRPAGFGVTDEEWSEAYLVSIEILQVLFSGLTEPADIKTIQNRFFRELGVDLERRNKRSIREIYPAYALGRGNGRVYKTPFALTFLQQNQIRWLAKLGWPKLQKAFVSNVFPIETKPCDWGLYAIKGNRGFPVSSDRYSNEGDALKAVLERIDMDGAPQVERKKIFNPVKPEVSKYLANPGLEEDSISIERLMKDFGISGIQFGNTLSNTERHNWVRNVYISFHVLEKIIQPANPKWLGLGGIKLAFGARGSSTAVAHFETSLNVINLTRQKGPGSLAHEWFHALDHRLGRSINWEFASQNFRKGSHQVASKDPKVLRACEISFISGAIHDRTIAGETSLLTRAHQLDSQTQRWKRRGYWSLPEELTARAFEAFIQDSWMEIGLDGSWLASGTLPTDYDTAHTSMHPYPLGDERALLNRRFSKLVELLFRRSCLGSAH